MGKTQWITMLIHCREITIAMESCQREQCTIVSLQQSEYDPMAQDRYEYFPLTGNCGIVEETLRIILFVAGIMRGPRWIPYLKVFPDLNKYKIPQKTVNDVNFPVKETMKIQRVLGEFVAGQFVADNSSRTIRRGQFVARTIRRKTIRRRTIRREYVKQYELTAAVS